MIREITARDLAKHIANGRPVLLLDVRQPWENQLAAIDGSVLIPLSELEPIPKGVWLRCAQHPQGHQAKVPDPFWDRLLPGRAAEIEPEADNLVVVYCHHGVRSLSGASMLARAGLKNVVSLAGGIDAWSREVDPGVPRY